MNFQNVISYIGFVENKNKILKTCNYICKFIKISVGMEYTYIYIICMADCKYLVSYIWYYEYKY